MQWHLHYIQSETSHIPKKHFYLKTKKRNRVDKQNNNNTQINICGKRVVSLQQQQLFTWLMCSVFPVVLTSSKVELGILKFFFQNRKIGFTALSIRNSIRLIRKIDRLKSSKKLDFLLHYLLKIWKKKIKQFYWVQLKTKHLKIKNLPIL